MAGGTLVVSRAVNLHPYYKERFEELRYKNVTVTGKDKDGLSMAIRDMKPDIVFIGASFYKCSTPYMVGELLHEFPKLRIAAVATGSEYPANLGMYFMVNGAIGYLAKFDGIEQFYNGFEEIRKGNEYISPSAKKSINIRSEYPMPSQIITKRQLEVIRCVSNGFTDREAADTLAVSKRTVSNEKKIICTSLNVRNEKELIRVALHMKWINSEELIFYGRDYVLKPVPDKDKKFRGKYK
jgi:DNA-binding NarL/FixJ family response regulator